MAGNKDVKRGIVIYIDGKEVNNNAKAIQAEMRKVKKEIDGCTLGSKEYIAATKRYKELNAILNEHKAKLSGVKKEHFSFINTINGLWQKWQVTIGAFLAAFAGVSLALSKFRKEMNETEESSANLKALTGLDDSSIQWLQEQAEILSTTMEKSGLRVQKTAKEILEAYMLVGSAKPELLQDKEALNAVTIEALRLAEAAKMSLKDAVDGVTLSLNQYGEKADQASRYVNVLAAGSKFGAANVENQTAAIIKAGVAASVAKVPIESLVGSIETLAEKGIKGEIAGTGLKTFFLKLEGMADDVRPSVVGLETALENLRKKNLSTAETQKLFGLEAYTVAQAMISGAEKVHDYTVAVTDTNVAIEQAAINSDTANAKLAQMKNEFTQQGIILVKELNPAITKFVSLGMNSTKMLVGVVRFLTEYRVTMTATSAVIAAYITFLNRKVIAEKLSVLWTDRLKDSTVGLFKTLKANPWGILLTAITAVTVALIQQNKKLEEQNEKVRLQNKLEETANKQYAEEAGKIDALTRKIKSNNLSIDERRKALNELKEIVPGYLADLTNEGKLVNDNKKAIDDYLVSLEKQIKLKAAQDELEKAYAEKRKKEKELQKKQEVEDVKRAANTNAKVAASLQGSGDNGYGKVGAAMNSSTNGVQKTTKELEKAVKAREKVAGELEKVNGDIKVLEEEIKNSDLGNQSSPNTGDGGNGGSGSGGSTTTTETTESKRIKAETAAIEAEMKNREAIIKQEYASGIKNRQQYSDEMQAIEIDRIQKLLKIAGLEPEKIAELKVKLVDFAVKARESLESIDFSSSFDSDEGQQLYNEYEKNLDRLNQKNEEQIAILQNNLTLRNITQEVFNQKKQELDTKFTLEQEKLWDEYVQKLLNSQSELIGSTDDNLEELTAITEKNLKLFNDTLRPLAESIGQSLVDSVKDALEDGRDPIKAALKAILKDVVNAIQKMMVASVAQRTIANVGTLGVWGIAKAAGEIALITAAGAGLNALIDSFADGGYTRKGSKYTPAGIVHAGEFVATQEAVNNPAVKPVLDAIDMAQRNGTIANLTQNDISAIRGNNNPASSSDNNSKTNALIAECIKVMQKVKERFDEPIIAETYATGKHGTIEAAEKVEMMKRNSKRN